MICVDLVKGEAQTCCSIESTGLQIPAGYTYVGSCSNSCSLVSHVFACSCRLANRPFAIEITIDFVRFNWIFYALMKAEGNPYLTQKLQQLSAAAMFTDCQNQRGFVYRSQTHPHPPACIIGTLTGMQCMPWKLVCTTSESG